METDDRAADMEALRNLGEESDLSALMDGGAESDDSADVKLSDSAAGQTVGDVIEGVLGSLSTEQTIAAGVGGLLLLAAMSGDRGGSARAGGSKVACPECGEKKSKRGMMGHLQWSHDLDSDQLDDAKAKAGIGR